MSTDQIYPKQIRKVWHGAKSNVCFVLMPFDPVFDEVYSEIKSSLKRIEFDCIRADDIYENRPIMSIIVTNIISSHFIIADLTTKNPNVFYEIGIAHSFREAQNVILISQDMSHVPFDMKHLPVIFYDKDNLKGLTSKLIKRVLENKLYFEGAVVIRKKYGHYYKTEFEIEEVLEKLSSLSNCLWISLLSMLGVEQSKVPNSDMSIAVFTLRNEMANLWLYGNGRLAHNLFYIFKDLVVFSCGVDEIYNYAIDILSKNIFPDFKVANEINQSMATDLGIALLENSFFKPRGVTWLMERISKPKVAGIDITRSKIEIFILNSNDEFIISSIVSGLDSENEMQRENCADIIGELKIESANQTLLLTLIREKNYYVARSIITALGKIGDIKSVVVINEWLEKHISEIKENKHTYVLSYAKTAIELIDKKNNSNFLHQSNFLY